MYCWKCGSPDQRANEYCNNCHEYLRDNSLFRAKDSPTAVLNWTIFYNISGIISLLVAAYLLFIVLRGGDRALLLMAFVVGFGAVFANMFNSFLAYRLRERIAPKKPDPIARPISELTGNRVAGLFSNDISHSYAGPSITESEEKEPVQIRREQVREKN